jgi:hypothetical protein
VAGKVGFRAESTILKMADVKGDADVHTSFGMVELREIGGNAVVSAPSSDVSADGIGGDIDVSNSFGKVILRRTAGSIMVAGGNSLVEIEDIVRWPEDGTVEVTTSDSPIKLSIPSKSRFFLTARSNYGSISSDFSGDREEISDYGEKMVIGNSGTRVRLETDDDITIKKQR